MWDTAFSFCAETYWCDVHIGALRKRPRSGLQEEWLLRFLNHNTLEVRTTDPRAHSLGGDWEEVCCFPEAQKYVWLSWAGWNQPHALRSCTLLGKPRMGDIPNSGRSSCTQNALVSALVSCSVSASPRPPGQSPITSRMQVSHAKSPFWELPTPCTWPLWC